MDGPFPTARGAARPPARGSYGAVAPAELLVTGKRDSEVIEEALRRDLGLDLLEQLWAKNQLPEEEAATLAVEAQHATRPRRR